VACFYVPFRDIPKVLVCAELPAPVSFAISFVDRSATVAV